MVESCQKEKNISRKTVCITMIRVENNTTPSLTASFILHHYPELNLKTKSRLFVIDGGEFEVYHKCV